MPIITSKYVYLDILCGVPQGSKCSGKLNTVMFADSTNFFLSGINIYSLFHPAALPVLKMDNIAIERKNVLTGVLIDENFSWKQHINDATTKISKSISICYKSRGIVKQPILKQLYFSFIHYQLCIHCTGKHLQK